MFRAPNPFLTPVPTQNMGRGQMALGGGASYRPMTRPAPVGNANYMGPPVQQGGGSGYGQSSDSRWLGPPAQAGSSGNANYMGPPVQAGGTRPFHPGGNVMPPPQVGGENYLGPPSGPPSGMVYNRAPGGLANPQGAVGMMGNTLYGQNGSTQRIGAPPRTMAGFANRTPMGIGAPMPRGPRPL